MHATVAGVRKGKAAVAHADSLVQPATPGGQLWLPRDRLQLVARSVAVLPLEEPEPLEHRQKRSGGPPVRRRLQTEAPARAQHHWLLHTTQPAICGGLAGAGKHDTPALCRQPRGAAAAAGDRHCAARPGSQLHSLRAAGAAQCAAAVLATQVGVDALR